jgi:hypothetical protein
MVSPDNEKLHPHKLMMETKRMMTWRVVLNKLLCQEDEEIKLEETKIYGFFTYYLKVLLFFGKSIKMIKNNKLLQKLSKIILLYSNLLNYDSLRDNYITKTFFICIFLNIYTFRNIFLRKSPIV